MSSRKGWHVVIIGGGLAGCATAYYLAAAGVEATIIERDSVASHASGFALGGLVPLGGTGIPGPLEALSLESFRMHLELAPVLKEGAGVDTQFQLLPAVVLAYTKEEVAALQTHLPWQQAQNGFTVTWKSGQEVAAMEPRLAPGVLGGVEVQHVGMLDPYRFGLALLQAAESRGATMRHGVARGLRFHGDRVRAVQVGDEEISCDAVVIAQGPWTGQAAAWLGIELPVEPLKGQILRLRAGGPPLPYLSWGHSYAVTKADGLVWAGTTEEMAGFDESPSSEGRHAIMKSVLQALPYLVDAEIVLHTACLRPVTPDGLPILGKVPDKDGVFIATGGGRKGVHLAPIMGRITADLVINGKTRFDIAALAPGRSFSEALSKETSSDPFRF